MTRDAVLFISRPDAVRERKVSRYWQRNVEPNHVHKWVRVSGTDRYSLSVAYSDGVWNGGFPPRELTEDAVIAVLRSLPTPSMRKLFMRQLWDSGWKSEDFEKSSKLYRDLQAAYESSPTRRDYRDILRRYGYRL
jgi:hypothetical protein